MTMNNESGESGRESVESRENGPPLMEASDRKVAIVLEFEKDRLREGVSLVNEALMNEDVPLTDEKVARFWDAATTLERLSETLARRVPEEHQLEYESE